MNTPWLLFASMALFSLVGAHDGHLGDPCTTNDECLDNRCYNQACTDLFLVGESCGVDADCATRSCNNNVCADRAQNGQACDSNQDCINTCLNSVCVDYVENLGGVCDDNIDCRNSSPERTCLFEECAERSEVGGACDEDGDCARYLKCNNDLCRLNEEGEQCGRDADCDGDLTCQNAFLGLETCGGEVGGIWCFSGLSTVEVKGKGLIPMQDLTINDWVRCEDGVYAQVFSFGHHEANKEAEYLRIDVESDKLKQESHHRLEISKEHLLFMHHEKTKKREVVPAESIKAGDWLVLGDGATTQVTNITKVYRRGAYSPLTTKGNILVGGVLASNYVTRSWIKDSVAGQTLHLLQHGGAFPYRIYCHVVGCQDETYDDVTGYSPWVMFWYGIEQWQLGLHPLLQALFLLVLAVPLALTVLVGAFLASSSSIVAINILAFLVGHHVWKKSQDKSHIWNNEVDGKEAFEERE